MILISWEGGGGIKDFQHHSVAAPRKAVLMWESTLVDWTFNSQVLLLSGTSPPPKIAYISLTSSWKRCEKIGSFFMFLNGIGIIGRTFQVQKEHHLAMGRVKRDAVTLEFSQADLGEGIAEAILVKA